MRCSASSLRLTSIPFQVSSSAASWAGLAFHVLVACVPFRSEHSIGLHFVSLTFVIDSPGNFEQVTHVIVSKLKTSFGARCLKYYHFQKSQCFSYDVVHLTVWVKPFANLPVLGRWLFGHRVVLCTSSTHHSSHCSFLACATRDSLEPWWDDLIGWRSGSSILILFEDPVGVEHLAAGALILCSGPEQSRDFLIFMTIIISGVSHSAFGERLRFDLVLKRLRLTKPIIRL